MVGGDPTLSEPCGRHEKGNARVKGERVQSGFRDEWDVLFLYHALVT